MTIGRVDTLYENLWKAWGGKVYHASEECPRAEQANGGRTVSNKNGNWRPCYTCMILKHHPYAKEYYNDD